MLRKLLQVTAGTAFLGFGTMPLLSLGPPAVQMTTAGYTDPSRKSLDDEMTNHQNEMITLTARLNESFQNIANARDAKGYVHDKALLKAHEVDIRSLRNAVREHKLFLGVYERQCGVTSKHEDIIIQHQHMMKAVLYDVVETFDTYEITNNGPNDPNVVPTEDIGLLSRRIVQR